MKNFFGNIFGQIRKNILEKESLSDCAEIDIIVCRQHQSYVNFETIYETLFLVENFFTISPQECLMGKSENNQIDDISLFIMLYLHSF